MGTQSPFGRFMGHCVRQGALIGAMLGVLYAVIMLARSALVLAGVSDSFATAPIQGAPVDWLPAHLLIVGGLSLAAFGAIGGILIGLLGGLAMYSSIHIALGPISGVRMAGWLLPVVGTVVSALGGWIGMQLLIRFGDPGDVAMWWYQVARNPLETYTLFNVIIGHIFFVQVLPIILTALGGWLASRRIAAWYLGQQPRAG